MITRRSAKNKGYKFQKEIARKLKVRYNLEERDIVSTPSSVMGEDLLLTRKAKSILPFSFELKRVEKLSIWSAIEQATSNCPKNRIPLVVFKRNFSKTYCTLEFEELLNLLDNKKMGGFKK